MLFIINFNKLQENHDNNWGYKNEIVDSCASFFLSQTAGAIVIGKDDRVVVTEHSKETWGTGVVYSEFPGENLYKCTGTLISDYYILTAAHCIFQPKFGGYAEKVSFLPGVLKSKTGFNDRYFAEHTWISKEYVSQKKALPSAVYPSIDIAFVKLIKNHKGQIPGKVYGFKGFAKPQNTNNKISVVAYKNEGKDKHTLYKHESCNGFYLQTNQYIATKCDTSVGSSGSGMLNKDKRIIGILTGQMENKVNLFTPLTDDYRNSISSLKSGKRPSNTFIKKELDPTMYFAVHLKNLCHKTIYIALTYKNLESKWVTFGFLELGPNEVFHNSFFTQNTIIGFYVQTYNGDLKWYGNDYKLKVQGKEYPFYKKQLPKQFTDQTFSWSCTA